MNSYILLLDNICIHITFVDCPLHLSLVCTSLHIHKASESCTTQNLNYFLYINVCTSCSATLFICISPYCFGVYATVCRLEFQYGFSIPVSQLEGVCGCLCPALCLRCGGTYLHARKSPVLPWGNGSWKVRCAKYGHDFTLLTECKEAAALIVLAKKHTGITLSRLPNEAWYSMSFHNHLWFG